MHTTQCKRAGHKQTSWLLIHKRVAVKKQNTSKDVDVTLTAVACLLTEFCLFSLYTWLWGSRENRTRKGEVTWNHLGRTAYTHKLRYGLISVGKIEGVLSVPLRRIGLMQKRIWGFFWTSRDFPSHRYQWKLERAEVPKRDTPGKGRGWLTSRRTMNAPQLKAKERPPGFLARRYLREPRAVALQRP